MKKKVTSFLQMKAKGQSASGKVNLSPTRGNSLEAASSSNSREWGWALWILLQLAKRWVFGTRKLKLERRGERWIEPDKISRRISDDEAGGAVVGGERGGAAVVNGGNVGGRRNGEIDPANSVASDYWNFLTGQGRTGSHFLPTESLQRRSKTLVV